jgi:archaemetzincin
MALVADLPGSKIDSAFPGQPGTLSAKVKRTARGGDGSRIARGSVALVAVGSASAVPAELQPALEVSFNCRVDLAPAIALPRSAYDPTRGQYLSTRLLDELARLRRPEWERVLGIADVDLHVADLNFVFGEADARRGVAVFSLARLRPGPAEPQAGARFLHRAIVEAVHELGHTWGLGHCDDAGCVMWFSNTLAETDHKRPEFCDAHRRRLSEAQARERRV